MRILYGVVGEGMGHATRSKVILEHLVGAGHEVEIVVSGRAHGFLSRSFPSLKVHGIEGLTMGYEDNRVDKSSTFQRLVGLVPTLLDSVEEGERIWEGFRPELCISDFETLSYLIARRHRLPVLSIDNMQILNRCDFEVEIPEDEAAGYAIAKSVVKGKLPGCDHYLITTFFFPPTRKERTTLYPPILRPAILEAKASAARGDHVLVYQTSESFTSLIPTLQQLPHRFLVYGLKRNADLGNVTLKDFSEQGFVDDLKTCRAVLAGGGFSLMGEAVFLGKPMLSVPVRGQFEQVLNALYLQQLCYGEYHPELTADGIVRFLGRIDAYAERLATYSQDGNRLILEGLDELIARIGREGRLVSWLDDL